MNLFLTNTMTGKIEKFSPINANCVTMYVCGPTVYNYAHIGNARPAVIFDVLYRFLDLSFEKVLYARNFTDVDDKISNEALKEKVDIKVITERYIKAYRSDMKALGVREPDFEPRVTEHIDEILAIIDILVEKGFAYFADGHVLFEVAKFAEYGALSGREIDQMMAGARVEIAPYKNSPVDFVLWKPSSLETPGWDSKWGFGRPGWHIECTAMINKIFRSTIDIHGGGADLVFPHHENEIAQGTCLQDGLPCSNYWVHNGHLTVEGKKMSKSLGNVLLVKDLLQKFSGEIIRYSLLSAHYRQPLDWSNSGLESARKSLKRIYQVLLDNFTTEQLENRIDVLHSVNGNRILSAISNDLNTVEAISAVHQIIKDIKNSQGEKEKLRLLEELLHGANVLGILRSSPEEWLSKKEKSEVVEDEILRLIQSRKIARQAKDFAKADQIRSSLLEKGISLEDGPTGTTWTILT